MLIEDNKDDEELIKRRIAKGGYKPIIFRVETEAALQIAIDESTWDVILCDYLLPHFSALKALEIVRKSLGDIPFIVLSGLEDEETEIKMIDAGANDYLYKSKPGRLAMTVRREMKEVGERMLQRLEHDRNIDLIIEAWGLALERRDIYTKSHTVRVTDLTLRLARALDVSDEQYKNIRYGALLHDIGKIGIPDMVLLKRDVLDTGEINIMRMHPGIAHEMLDGMEFLQDALSIPYCHHEKFDGTGYPRGLAGEEIPYEARIFSVCDVYDALTTDRPYRKARSKEEVLEHIRKESGKSFDPQIVEKFLEMMK